MQRQKTRSPCIGVCSTGIGDSVCRGCKRYSHEVIDWNGYSEAQRLAIVKRLSLLVQHVAEPMIEIHDTAQLQLGLQQHQIRFDPNAGPYLWLLELLKVGAGTLPSLERFGCRLRPAAQGRSLIELKAQIDHDFYILSTVHYERYFRHSPAEVDQ